MKIIYKAVLVGFFSIFVFLIGNGIFTRIIGIIFSGGDNFMNSYFYPLYAAFTLLCSLIVSCTYLIIKKIDMLSDKISDK